MSGMSADFALPFCPILPSLRFGEKQKDATKA